MTDDPERVTITVETKGKATRVFSGYAAIVAVWPAGMPEPMLMLRCEDEVYLTALVATVLRRVAEICPGAVEIAKELATSADFLKGIAIPITLPDAESLA